MSIVDVAVKQTLLVTALFSGLYGLKQTGLTSALTGFLNHVEPETSSCEECLAAGKDFCIADSRCIPRATFNCQGPEDHITGDLEFALHGNPEGIQHLMVCPKKAVEPKLDAEERRWRKAGKEVEKLVGTTTDRPNELKRAFAEVPEPTSDGRMCTMAKTSCLKDGVKVQRGRCGSVWEWCKAEMKEQAGAMEEKEVREKIKPDAKGCYDKGKSGVWCPKGDSWYCVKNCEEEVKEESKPDAKGCYDKGKFGVWCPKGDSWYCVENCEEDTASQKEKNHAMESEAPCTGEWKGRWTMHDDLDGEMEMHVEVMKFNQFKGYGMDGVGKFEVSGVVTGTEIQFKKSYESHDVEYDGMWDETANRYRGKFAIVETKVIMGDAGGFFLVPPPRASCHKEMAEIKQDVDTRDCYFDKECHEKVDWTKIGKIKAGIFARLKIWKEQQNKDAVRDMIPKVHKMFADAGMPDDRIDYILVKWVNSVYPDAFERTSVIGGKDILV